MGRLAQTQPDMPHIMHGADLTHLQPPRHGVASALVDMKESSLATPAPITFNIYTTDGYGHG